MENEKKIEIDNFISLESGKMLFVLEEIEVGSRQFVYTVEISLDGIPKQLWDFYMDEMVSNDYLFRTHLTNNYDFHEAIIIDGEEYIVEIDDELYDPLRDAFREQIMWKLENYGYDPEFIDILFGKTA